MIKITNKIEAKLTFNKYIFSRVKPTSNNTAVIYTDKAWVGKEVSIIPMKLTITDRYIDNCWNEETNQYEMTAETDVIFKKTVRKGNVGRIHIPTDYIGLDVLIIETPTIKDLY